MQIYIETHNGISINHSSHFMCSMIIEPVAFISLSIHWNHSFIHQIFVKRLPWDRMFQALEIQCLKKESLFSLNLYFTPKLAGDRQ